MTQQSNSRGGLLSRVARLPSLLRSRRKASPPQKALILQPCCVGQVMLTTPLLAALSKAFPAARFDWAVSDWALPAIGSNPRITRLIRTGAGDLEGNTSEETKSFLDAVRREQYDTCFIPDTSSLAARLAWRAGIRQRIGLDLAGRGGTHTLGISLPDGEHQAAVAFLSLATAAGVDEAVTGSVEMEFEPPDHDRATMTRWLVEEFDWLGDTPLVVMHPGGGDNPADTNLDKRWPAERFSRLANYLVRTHGARVALVGLEEERPLTAQVGGMMSFPAANLAGRIRLGELGALCELASLYVGNDAGSTYVAAATGCPTLAIYGPTDPAVYGPYMISGRVTTLWRPFTGTFSWHDGVSVDEAIKAADELLTS